MGHRILREDRYNIQIKQLGHNDQYPCDQDETVKIWIGVDTGYPAEDAFTQGREGFNNYQPYFMQWIVLALGANPGRLLPRR